MRPMICALCGKNQVVRELYPATFDEKDLTRDIYSARRLPDRIHYSLMRCNRCGLIFSNPILPPATITKLYRESVCKYQELIRYTARTYRDIFAKIRGQIPKKPRVLEVGCGNGFFLDALYKGGIQDVWGVEPGQDMVNNAPAYLRQRITVDILRPKQFPARSFDVVCCFHTLDHMMDPAAFVKIAYEVLKPHGYAVVVVHDTDGLSVKLFGERSPIFDIEHIYLFNKTNLQVLFETYGFVRARTFDVANTYPLSYWLRMSPLPATLKSFGQRVLRLTHLDNHPVTTTGGNIALVAQKPYKGKLL